MKLKVVLSYLCLLIGFSIFGTYALSLRFDFSLPTEVYWLSFAFVSIPLLWEVVFWKDRAKSRLFYLLMFSLMIHLQYAVVDSSPFLSSPDAVGDYRLTSKIITDTRWMPFEQVEWSFGWEYRYYPITNFIYASISMLSGIPLLMIVKYLFVVKAFVVPPLINRWFLSFFHQRMAYLATVIFLVSPGAILFPHKESFALIFFFIGMYAVTPAEKTRQYLLLGLLSILTLIMTHHFTTYIFLGLLTLQFLASRFFKGVSVHRFSDQFIMSLFVAFASWATFIAWTIITQHQEFLSNVFLEVLLPGKAGFSELLPQYASYEKMVIWLGTGISGISAVIGFLAYAKDRKNLSPSFFAVTLLLIPLLGVATIFRFSSSRLNVLISHRAYEFGYIAVGAFCALFFVRAFHFAKKSTLKGILIGSIILIILVGPMAGAMHPRTFARVSKIISSRGLSLNSWMSESGAHNEYTIVDSVANVLLAGYGRSSVIVYPELFTSPVFNMSLEMSLKSSYVVTYEYMRDFYGPYAARFDNLPYFNNLYTNGILNIYDIRNYELP